MWFPSISSIALAATAIHLVSANRIEARDGMQTVKNAFTDPVNGVVNTTLPVVLKWKVSHV